MKKTYWLLTLSLSAISLRGMQFIGKIEEAYHRMKDNPRDLYKLFIDMHNKHYKDEKQISRTELIELKKNLDITKKWGIQCSDPLRCVTDYYSDLYTIVDEKDNIYFVDEILPLVLKDHLSFESDITFKNRFVYIQDNPYLMRALFYRHDVSLVLEEEENCLFLHKNDIQKIQKKHSFISTQMDYIKAVLTPPESIVQQARKKVLQKMLPFMLCLNRLKKNNKISYNVPKPILFNYILFPLVEDAIPDELKLYANNRMQELKNKVKYIQKRKGQLQLLESKMIHLNNMHERHEEALLILDSLLKEWGQKNINTLKTFLLFFNTESVLNDNELIKALTFHQLSAVSECNIKIDGLNHIFQEDFIENVIKPLHQLTEKYRGEKIMHFEGLKSYIQSVVNEVFFDCKEDEKQEIVRYLRQVSFEKFRNEFFKDIIPFLSLAEKDFQIWMEQTMNLTCYVFNRIKNYPKII